MNKSFHLGSFFLKLITILLSVALAMELLTLISLMSEDLSGYSKAELDDFHFALESHDYVWLANLEYRPMSNKVREEVKGYIAAADYFEAAALYKAYIDADRSDEANAVKTTMDALVPILKETKLSWVVEDIHSRLGLSDSLKMRG